MVTILGPSRQMHSRVFMASQLTLSRVSLSQEVHFEQVNLLFHLIDDQYTFLGNFPPVSKRQIELNFSLTF